MNEKHQPQHIVFVVDDDKSMRVALTYLFQSMNLPVKVFTSAAELLESELPDIVSAAWCSISGCPASAASNSRTCWRRPGSRIPIVFMTGHGDIPMSVRAMKAGAVDFLTKPFRDQDMLDAVTRALRTRPETARGRGGRRPGCGAASNR